MSERLLFFFFFLKYEFFSLVTPKLHLILVLAELNSDAQRRLRVNFNS